MATQRKFRTGAEFKHSCNDGRQVWVSGERITDISSHPATRGVVDALAEWYDLHHDPAWTDILLDTQGEPLGLTIPRSGDDLWALAESIRAFAVRNARERAALLHLLHDATASSLEGREAAFTALSTGGMHLWKLRVGLEWHKHNALARTALALLDDWQDKQVDYTPPNPLAPPPGPSGGGRHEGEQG